MQTAVWCEAWIAGPIPGRTTAHCRSSIPASGSSNFLGEEWTYNLSLNYGRFENSGQALNNRNNVKFLNAVDAVDDGNGNAVCRDPDAVADGCLALNLFGYGMTDAAAIDYIMERGSTWEEEMSQTVANVYIAGPVARMPAGNLDVVMGHSRPLRGWSEHRQQVLSAHQPGSEFRSEPAGCV